MKKLHYLFIVIWFSWLTAVHAVELNIATVNNGHMIEMQKLTSEFENAYPDIQLNWHVYNEGSLRMRVIADIAAKAEKYDVVTIGMYETPIWAERGWLLQLNPSSNFDINDLLPAVRNGLSHDGKLYASPFYGESSILMYRKDLLDAVGISINQRPSWQRIRDIAQAIHKPDEGIYGICLRGKSGWGDNMALVSTMVNGFGGRWFDMNWRPQVSSGEWREAVTFYINLLRDFGPPNSEDNSFNEILALSRDGKCGMWVDASIAASFVSDTRASDFADKWAFAQSPYKKTQKGANWLWAWALAIPSGTSKADAAQTFISWATSKQYIELIATKNGWANVPTGTRKSTYNNSEFMRVAGNFANAELAALNSANPEDNTLLPSPYKGIQFVPIPEFVSIAGITGLKIREALQGQVSIQQALGSSQKFAEREIRRSRSRN